LEARIVDELRLDEDRDGRKDGQRDAERHVHRQAVLPAVPKNLGTMLGFLKNIFAHKFGSENSSTYVCTGHLPTAVYTKSSLRFLSEALSTNKQNNKKNHKRGYDWFRNFVTTFLHRLGRPSAFVPSPPPAPPKNEKQ
jgi:hypothetical protein